jgi:hypothetical protein
MSTNFNVKNCKIKLGGIKPPSYEKFYLTWLRCLVSPTNGMKTSQFWKWINCVKAVQFALHTVRSVSNWRPGQTLETKSCLSIWRSWLHYFDFWQSFIHKEYFYTLFKRQVMYILQFVLLRYVFVLEYYVRREIICYFLHSVVDIYEMLQCDITFWWFRRYLSSLYMEVSWVYHYRHFVIFVFTWNFNICAIAMHHRK